MLPAQTEVLPEMTEGVPGAEFTLTVKVWTAEEPQPLFAITEIVPPVAPAVAVIELVVEVPDHPDGSVHV